MIFLVSVITMILLLVYLIKRSKADATTKAGADAEEFLKKNPEIKRRLLYLEQRNMTDKKLNGSDRAALLQNKEV